MNQPKPVVSLLKHYGRKFTWLSILLDEHIMLQLVLFLNGQQFPISRVLTKTEKCSLTKTDEFCSFYKAWMAKNIRGTESYVNGILAK